jgi:hypothetical protein
MTAIFSYFLVRLLNVFMPNFVQAIFTGSVQVKGAIGLWVHRVACALKVKYRLIGSKIW